MFPTEFPAGAGMYTQIYQNKRVLVVATQNDETTLLMAKLRDLGLDCALADSRCEAITLLEHAAKFKVIPALIIIAPQLPDSTGAQFIDDLRHDRRFDNIRAIIAAPTANQVKTTATAFNPYLHAKSDGIIETVSGLMALNSGGTLGSETDRAAIMSKLKEPKSDVIDILVAEDNDINQLVLSQFLDETPYRFSIVSNGRRAVHAFRHSSPRLILMDISMPQMNGKEATAAIRAIERAEGGHVPIIALTAHALAGDREDCLSAGMDDYMSKPVIFAKLRTLLDQHLANSGKQRAA